MIEVTVSPDRLAAGEPGELTVELRNTGTGPCANIVFKWELPRQVVLLSGGNRLQVPRLDAGKSVTRVLRVRPDEIGSWPITSGNFSYRDHAGRPQRVTGFRADLVVEPPPPAVPPPAPDVAVSLVDARLPVGEWSELRGRVTNTGVPDLIGVEVGVSGPFEVDGRSTRQALGTLSPGQTAEFTTHVHPTSSGRSVPVHLDVEYRTDAGPVRSTRFTVAVHVHDAVRQVNEPVRILYLSANPSDTPQLRLAAELREIQQTLRMGGDRDRYELHHRGAVRARDITQALLDVRPRIVHFSGHGDGTGRLQLENEVGMSRVVAVDGLAALFKEFSEVVECVIVSACDTALLAEAVAAHVDHVIGMRQEIGDRAAIAFSIGFYQALAANEPLEKAFNLACVQIQLDATIGPEFRTPLLLKRPV